MATGELYIELNIGFSMLETMVAMLKLQSLHQFSLTFLHIGTEEHHMQAFQDFWNQHEAEGDIFLGHLSRGD